MKMIGKRILICLLVVVTMLASVPMSGFVGLQLPKLSQLFAVKASAATEYKSGYYTYTVSGGKATITDVDDSISGSVTIPSKLGGYPVTEIGAGAFSYCTKLEYITISNSVKKVGRSAFYNCYKIAGVKIPDSVTIIDEWAFDGCYSLANVTIPNSVTSIGQGAFYYCESIVSLTIPAGVEKIGSCAFLGSGIKRITVDKENRNYSSENNALFNKNKTLLIQCFNSQKDYYIPNGVINIGEFAFGCSNLSNVIIPNSVKCISSNAFSGCQNLTCLTIPNSVTKIESEAFNFCSNLERLFLSAEVVSIGYRAFYFCDKLKTINFNGSRAKWAEIIIDEGNANLLNADISFTDSGSKLKLTAEQAVNVFMRYEDVWKEENDPNSYWYSCYGFIDLNFDGILELVKTFNQGSPYYEYSYFYKIDSKSLRVKQIEEYNDGYFSDFSMDNILGISYKDLSGLTSFRIIQNKSSGEKMYYGGDILRIHDEFEHMNSGILCEKNGKVYQKELYGWEIDHYNNDRTTYYSYDNKHNSSNITKQKYEDTVKDFWKNNTDLNGECSPVSVKTYHNATQEQKRQYLLQSYCAFGYDGYENDDIIAEHYNFIKNNTTYSGRIKKANFAYEMASYQDDFQYKWFNLLSKIGLKFENYYDVALTELILSQTSAKKANELSQEYVGKQEVEITKGFISIITDLIDKYDDSCELKGTIEKNTIEKFVSGSLDKSSNSYKLLARFLNGKKVKPVFEKAISVYDRSGTFFDIAGTLLDVVNNMIGVRNYICAVNAYISYNQYFKQMFVDTYKLVYNAGNKKLAQSMKKYINANSSVIGYAKECATAIREGKMKSCYDIFVGIFLKQTLSAVGTFAAGIKIAGTTVGALVSTKVAGCTIAGIASSVAAGLSLGSLAGRLLTNSDEWMDSIGVVIPAGELSYYVKKVMLNYEKSFLKSLTEKNAFLFDSAFCFYNNLEIYACSHTIDAIKGQKDSFALKWQKQKQLEADEAIKGTKEVLALHNMVKCHKTDLIVAQIAYSQSVVYTGKKLTPQVKISDKIAGEDYTVTYGKNTDIGVGKIIITAKGGYTRGSVVETFTIVPDRPQYVKALQTDQSTCSLLWSSVPAIDGYKVTVIDSKTNKVLSSVAVKDNFALLTGLKSNVKYLVKVKAYKKVEAKPYYGREISKAIQLSNACGITKLIARKSSSAIKLAWNEVDGATGYRIYRYDSQKKRYIVLSDTTKTYYYDNTAKVGEPYYYAVKALQKCGKEIRLESNYKTVKYTLTLDAPVLNVTAGKGKVTLSWNKQSKATGYVIYMATSKSGKYSRIATLKSNSAISYTKTGLTKGKVYYFKVAAYATVGGKNIYGDFSTVKYIRAK